MLAVPGEMETATCVGCDTVTPAEADLVGSAELVALTVYAPAVDGAVYRPVVVIVPPVAFHKTAVLLVPDTEATNCCCAPV